MIDSKEILDAFNWRYAIKAFDSEKLVGETEKHALLESVRMTASSFGLQPFRVMVIRDKDIQQELQKASFGQLQIGTASDVLVFAAQKAITEESVDSYINVVATERGVQKEDLAPYRQMVLGMTAGMSKEAQTTWAQKQAYIALGSLLETAALLRIDSCPMEGFDAAAYDEILGLSQMGLTATVLCPIGYREKGNQPAGKVRFPAKDFFLSL